MADPVVRLPRQRPIKRVGPIDSRDIAPLPEINDERFTRLPVDHSVDPDVLNALNYQGYTCKQDSRWMFWSCDGVPGKFSSLRTLFEAIDQDIRDKAA